MCHRLLQTRPAAIPEEILHYKKRYAGSRFYVHTVSFILAWYQVHPSYGSQVSRVAASF